MFGAVDCQLYTAFFGLIPHDANAVFRDVGKADGGQVGFPSSCFHHGQVEKVIDKGEQMFAAGVNILDILLVTGIADGAKALQPHDLRKAVYDIERGSQFVADSGQELRFPRIGPLRRVTRRA